VLFGVFFLFCFFFLLLLLFVWFFIEAYFHFSLLKMENNYMVTFGVLIMYTLVIRGMHFLFVMDSNDTLIIAVSANILCS